jgi:hypothetical protein
MMLDRPLLPSMIPLKRCITIMVWCIVNFVTIIGYSNLPHERKYGDRKADTKNGLESQ